MPQNGRVLAVASSGGHWSQLLLLRDAFAGRDVVFATTLAGSGEAAGLDHVELIPDCNRHNLARIPRLFIRALAITRRVKPRAIITTGALPGLVFIIVGRLIGARTIWIESMANSEELSMSGRWASRLAHHCLVQWPSLAVAGRTRYAGSVL